MRRSPTRRGETGRPTMRKRVGGDAPACRAPHEPGGAAGREPPPGLPPSALSPPPATQATRISRLYKQEARRKRRRTDAKQVPRAAPAGEERRGGSARSGGNVTKAGQRRRGPKHGLYTCNICWEEATAGGTVDAADIHHNTVREFKVHCAHAHHMVPCPVCGAHITMAHPLALYDHWVERDELHTIYERDEALGEMQAEREGDGGDDDPRRSGWLQVFGPQANRRRAKGKAQVDLSGELGSEEPVQAEREDGTWEGTARRPVDRLVEHTGLPVLGLVLDTGSAAAGTASDRKGGGTLHDSTRASRRAQWVHSAHVTHT